MESQEMTRIKSQLGLSLMEVITSVAIIGLLTAISYPSWNAVVRKSRSNEVKINLAMVSTSMNNYNAHCKTFYPNLKEIGAIPEGYDLYYNVGLRSDPAETWSSCFRDDKKPCVGTSCPQLFSQVCCNPAENPCEKECRLKKEYTSQDFYRDVVNNNNNFEKCGTWADTTKTIIPDKFCIFGASNISGHSDVWMITHQGDLLEIQ